MNQGTDPPDAADLVGRTLVGRYRLEALLGNGAMGVVYRAAGPESARAVKVLFRESTSGEGALRFLRESRLLVELNHPNVVRLFEAGRDPDLDLHYLVMALMRGRDLAAILGDQAPLDPTIAVRVVAQAARGVSAAHRAGIVHRDLKPENLFLDVAEDDDERIVRVCDFGLAKRIGVTEATALTRSGSWLGTPSYMSPEQIQSSKHVDERTDVWSLGVTLYEMLTGRLPFAEFESSLASLLTAICTSDAPHIQDAAPWLDPGLALVVHKALTRDPEQRFRSVAELAEAVKRFAAGSELLLEGKICRVAEELRKTVAERADLAANVDSYFVHVELEADPIIGHELGGRYRIRSLLGRGGMGVVYRAETSDGEQVAAKLIAAHAAKDEMAVRRLVREVRAAKSVESPNVVKTLDTGTDDTLGVPYIILELLTGVDMGVLLKNEGALPPDVTARLFLQSARGLAAAHARGIVHRDIKPANLFLHCDDGGEQITVKLCDFGVAKQLHADAYDQTSFDLTSTGGLLGSPVYMSPEQARNAKSVTPATDVWSLSVAMWEALSGRRLWGAQQTLGELILAICTEPIPTLAEVAPWVPTKLSDIVQRGLARELLDRWADASELAAALEEYTQGECRVLSSDLRGLGAEYKAVAASPTTASNSAIARSASVRELSTLGHSATEAQARPPVVRRRGLGVGLALLAAGLLAGAAFVFGRVGAGTASGIQSTTAEARRESGAASPVVSTVDGAPVAVEPDTGSAAQAVTAPTQSRAAKVVNAPSSASSAPATTAPKLAKPASSAAPKPVASSKPQAPALTPKEDW